MIKYQGVGFQVDGKNQQMQTYWGQCEIASQRGESGCIGNIYAAAGTNLLLKISELQIDLGRTCNPKPHSSWITGYGSPE
jgi:hypothetical protein